jgi:hypothetical protein
VNQHLDVYGVLYTPEIWRMGDCLGHVDQSIAKTRRVPGR